MLYVSDTRGDFALHFIVKVSQDRVMSLYDSFAWKIVLKRTHISDTEEDIAIHIHCSGLPGDSAHPVSMIVLHGR